MTLIGVHLTLHLVHPNQGHVTIMCMCTCVGYYNYPIDRPTQGQLLIGLLILMFKRVIKVCPNVHRPQPIPNLGEAIPVPHLCKRQSYLGAWQQHIEHKFTCTYMYMQHICADHSVHKHTCILTCAHTQTHIGAHSHNCAQ